MTDTDHDDATMSFSRVREHPRLSAKSTLPRVPGHTIDRPRLNERLNSFESLAIVHAPVGFGKTTLVSAWAEKLGASAGDVVWFDAKRSDERSFWPDMLTAFEESGIPVPDNGSTPYQRLSGATHSRSAVLTLVIDGYDSVSESAEIEDALHDLLVRRRRLRVVVTLRRIHPFTSIRWSDLDISIIGAHDLAFTGEETAQLTELFGRSLSDETVTTIADATYGWPEPTRALIAEVQRRGLTRADIPAAAIRVAHDYLIRRVIPQFDGHDWLTFMFSTSIPHALTDELAVFISRDSAAVERLQRLESEGVLTVTPTKTGRVYEWPEAARVALQEEFNRRDRDHAREIHGNLATWYLDRDHAHEALEHARLAHDTELVVGVIERGWPRLLSSYKEELRSAFSSLPIESLTTHPGVAAVRDIVLHLQSQPDDLFLSIIGPSPGPGDRREIARLARTGDALTALRTMEAIMIALRGRGRFRHAMRYADAIGTICTLGREHQTAQIAPVVPGVLMQNGITRLVGDDIVGALLDLRYSCERSAEGSNPYAERDAASKIVLIHALTGDLKSADTWWRRYSATGRAAGWVEGTISQSAAVASALVAIERFDRDRAAAILAELAVPLDYEQTWSPFLVYAQARYALAWGDRHNALLQIEHERAHHADWLQKGSTANALLYAIEADLVMALGLGNRARDLLERAPRHPALFAARARFVLMTEGGQAAVDTTTPGVDDAVSMTVRAELLLIRAIAEWEIGNEQAAAESLRYAINVARTNGSPYPFATVSERLAPVAEQNADALELFEAATASGASPIFPARLETIALTERKRFVLDRIARGMNMRQMADELFVSYNTVKTQMRSLYQKLGARSREQALVRAREHGLLSKPRDDLGS